MRWTEPILVICTSALVVACGCQSSNHSDLGHDPYSTNLVADSNPSMIQEGDSESDAIPPQSIEEYVAIGLENNPQVRELENRIQALTHRVPQVSALPDPTVNTTTYLSPVETAAGRQQFGMGVNQKFVRGERRHERAQVACNEIKAAEAQLLDLGLEIAKSIRVACYQLQFVRAAIGITKEDRDSLARIAKIVEEQYGDKKTVTLQDVENVRIEQSKVDNELTALQQKEKSYRARLARLLHLDPKSEFQFVSGAIPTTTKYDLDALIEQAVRVRPDLQAQLAVIQQHRHKARLAELENKPDFTVGLNWIATSSSGLSPVANGDDALMLGIGFNLPINQGRIQSGICEALANTRASVDRLESLKDMAAEEVVDLVAKIESTQETLALIREDIIPRAERTLKLSMVDYENTKIDYVQLIANWRTLLRYRLTEQRLASELKQLVTALHRAVGNFEIPKPSETK